MDLDADDANINEAWSNTIRPMRPSWPMGAKRLAVARCRNREATNDFWAGRWALVLRLSRLSNPGTSLGVSDSAMLSHTHHPSAE